MSMIDKKHSISTVCSTFKEERKVKIGGLELVLL